MLKTLVAAAMLASSAAYALAVQEPGGAAAQAPTANVCKYVVAAEPGAKPYELCLSQPEWAAREAAAAADSNRLVCHYEESIGSRLAAKKICQPASEWANQQDMHREQTEKIQMGVCVPGAGC